MALKINKVDVWGCEIPDRPGGLAHALAPLADAGARFECVIARREKPGKGVVYVTPLKGSRQQKAGDSTGFKKAEDVATLRIEGTDAPGLGRRITQAVADAGVNMRGLSAAVVGKTFVAYLGLDSAADADKAQRAIKRVR